MGCNLTGELLLQLRSASSPAERSPGPPVRSTWDNLAATSSSPRAACCAPGNSAGQTQILGDLAALPGGTMQIEIGGFTRRVSFDRVVVDGDVTLGGSNLQLSLLNGVLPFGSASRRGRCVLFDWRIVRERSQWPAADHRRRPRLVHCQLRRWQPVRSDANRPQQFSRRHSPATTTKTAPSTPPTTPSGATTSAAARPLPTTTPPAWSRRLRPLENPLRPKPWFRISKPHRGLKRRRSRARFVFLSTLCHLAPHPLSHACHVTWFHSAIPAHLF